MPYHHPISVSSSASSSFMDEVVDDSMASPYHTPDHFSWCNGAHNDSESCPGYHSYDPTPIHASQASTSHTPHYPLSPPPLNYRKSPYTTIPLPSQGPPTHLDRILRYHRVPAIIWNILSPVHNAQCPSRPTAHWRAAWASSPARPSLDIRTSFVDCPIVVFSSAQTFVTIGDVLEAISRAIRFVDRGRSLAGQIQGDAVRPAESRPVIGLGMADHQTDQGGGAPTRDGDSARAIMWGGLVQSRTESEVWILSTCQT